MAVRGDYAITLPHGRGEYEYGVRYSLLRTCTRTPDPSSFGRIIRIKNVDLLALRFRFVSFCKNVSAGVLAFFICVWSMLAEYFLRLFFLETFFRDSFL